MRLFIIGFLFIFLMSCMPLERSEQGIETSESLNNAELEVSVAEEKVSLTAKEELISYLEKTRNYPEYELVYEINSFPDEDLEFSHKLTLALNNTIMVVKQENSLKVISEDKTVDEVEQYERIEKSEYILCTKTQYSNWNCITKKISEDEYAKLKVVFSDSSYLSELQDKDVTRAEAPSDLGNGIKCFSVDRSTQCYDVDSGFIVYAEKDYVKQFLKFQSLESRRELFENPK